MAVSVVMCSSYFNTAGAAAWSWNIPNVAFSERIYVSLRWRHQRDEKATDRGAYALPVRYSNPTPGPNPSQTNVLCDGRNPNGPHFLPTGDTVSKHCHSEHPSGN